MIVARRGNFTNFLFSPSLLLLLLLLYRLRTIIFSFRYRYDRQRTSLVCVLTLVSRIPIGTVKNRACLPRRSWSQSRSPLPPSHQHPCWLPFSYVPFVICRQQVSPPSRKSLVVDVIIIPLPRWTTVIGDFGLPYRSIKCQKCERKKQHKIYIANDLYRVLIFFFFLYEFFHSIYIKYIPLFII